MRSLSSSVGGGGGLGGIKGAAGDLLSSLGNVSEILTAIPVVGGAIKSVVGAVTGPLASLAQRGLEFNDIVEEAMIGFETMLGSEVKAREHIESLKKFAKTTPFEFRDLIGYSQMLQGMGFRADEIEPKLRAVGDALSAMGRTDRLDSVLEAMGKIKSLGKVSAEEINRIAETGINVYAIMSKAVGLSTKELQKLGEQGRLNADEFIDILTSELEKKYAGAMDKISQRTRKGALSNLMDNLDQLSGQALRGVHDGMTEAMQTTNEAFDKGLGTGVASTIGRMGTTVAELFNQALKGILTGDFLTKMSDAAGNIVNTAAGTIVDNTPGFVRSMSDMAVQGYDSFATAFGIQSPSRKMIEAGEFIAEGLEIGLNKSQARVYAAMKRLFNSDPDFLAKLIAEATKRGINPDHLLNVMAIESGFNKSVQNRFGYTGLIQFGDAERKEVGMPRETWGEAGRAAARQFLATISASEQLDYVFRYLDSRAHGQKLDTQAKVYATVGAGSYRGDSDDVRFARGSRGAHNNPLWDVNHDGQVQNWEFGPAALGKLGAGVAFTVNGSAITSSNPMPVAVVADRRQFRTEADRWAPMGKPDESGRDPFVRPSNFDELARQSVATRERRATNGANSITLPKAITPQEIDRMLAAMPPLTIKMSDLGIATQGVVVDVAALDAELAKAGATGEQTVEARRKRLIGAASKDLEAMRLQWGEVASGFNSVFAGALSDTEKTFGEWSRDLLLSLAQMLQQMAAQVIAANVTQWLFGTLSPTPGGGAGGKLGGIASLFSNLFGGARATGGRTQAGRMYLVGENGPEIWASQENGYVTPNHHLANAGGRGGGQGAGGNMRFVAVFDSRHVTQAMSSSEGERVFMAHFQNNMSQIKERMQRAA